MNYIILNLKDSYKKNTINENIPYQKFWDAVKAVLVEKLNTISSYLKKEESFPINILIL